MRPGQNKRMRGRNNNNGGNRKGPNPLARSYESNGPDVKIRGNAHHIAEKYLQLARDAQSSGDPVGAESYLQHAEHYFRLIASYQQQVQQGFARQADEFEDDDGEDAIPDRFASPQPAAPFVPQPQGGQPYNDRQPPYSGEQRQPYQERNGDFRGPRPDRNGQDRNGQDRNGQDRNGQRRPYRDDNRNGDQRQGEFRGSEGRGEQQRYGEGRQPYEQRRNGYDRHQERFGGERGYREAQPEPARDPGEGEQPLVTLPPVAMPAPPRVTARAEAAAPPETTGRSESEARRPADEEAPGLPSFITTPTRTPSPAPELPLEAAQPTSSESATSFPGDEAGAAPTFPRRRRRTTRTAAKSADAPAEPSPTE